MKKMTKLTLSIGLSSIIAVSCAAGLTTQKDRLSYAMGYQTGKALKMHQVKIDSATFAAGLKAASNGAKPQMTEKQMQATIMQFQKNAMAAMQKKVQVKGATNAKAGAKFLAANKTKAGVKVLKSGLQYKVLTAGSGKHPGLKDTVTINYEGKLINGTVFDSSYKRGKPISFPLAGLIKGWQQAIPLMKVGATWDLYIPAKLAYGDHAPAMIGPSQTLIFKVNLLAIKSKLAK